MEHTLIPAGHHGWVDHWTTEFIDSWAGLDQAAVGEGAFRPGPAIWVGRREVAHFDDERTLDIRLTRVVIRAGRAELSTDHRVHLSRGSSDWLEVQMTDGHDADFALALIRDAIKANLPSAPLGSPPAGAELERRRRFH